ncbi:MAG: 1,4-alpha-glucan branching protein GlgB [Synergistaceae bacterium]|jgi:1,4-alpha-glucan branching enzyme|nr:1,4-alpha-glucan branching protein GlgB [Synergistaceae bacterium]
MSKQMVANKVRYDESILTDYDIFLFKQGTHYTLYEKMGAHKITSKNGVEGVFFAVWAPNAKSVSVVGDFNQWNPASHPLSIRWDGSGIWEGFVPGLEKWDLYKFHIQNSLGEHKDKMDPFSTLFEIAPRTSSILHWPDYVWNDAEWMSARKKHTSLSAPWSVYEVHLGSWKHHWDDGLSLSYRELAEELPRYCKEMGFTAVEMLPIMEHPFYGSWGYQTLGHFAPSSRYGSPEDFMFLVDKLHQSELAVILDWVPSHFPTDDFGLARYDGTALYEHEDPRKGFHPDWGSYIFNYSRNEVRSYLISSAIYWLDRYHIDGLRLDAVASMLHLDYSRKAGEWEPNVHGGRENLEAIALLQDLNKEVYGRFPDVQTIAEESTDWPMVTRPVFLGGLGFGMKWNMGWMHDMLSYMTHEPVHRSYHHNQLTFSIWYAFSENFMLPISHDEVVHGKGSLINKMSGDWWQRRANLRLMLGYMWAHPGKKLLFMGCEFGQGLEWNYNTALEWRLLDNPDFQGIRQWVKDLNSALRRYPPLYERDFTQDGFRWIDCTDWQKSVVVFLRSCAGGEGRGREYILAAANFTPVPRGHYRVGAPEGGFWSEVLNSDASVYGGSGMGNAGGMEAEAVPCHGQGWSLPLTLPPLSIVVFHLQTRSAPQEGE